MKKFLNLFDILFILLVILLLFCAYYRFFLSRDKEIFESTTQIEYISKVENINKELIDNIKIGDSLFLKNNIGDVYFKIGTITNFEIEPYKDLQWNLDGTIKEVEVPELYNVILTINENGKVIDNNFYSSTNKELYMNEIISVATKYVQFDMKIENIGEIK